MKLKRTYVEGWYHAMKWIYGQHKKHDNRVFKIRLKMWKQLIKKKHFWLTPQGRVKQMEESIEALQNLGTTLSPETVEYINEDKSIVDQIHIYFENCEVIEVPYSDVRFLSMWGIGESVWDNNIQLKESFEFKFRKRAQGMKLIIKDKPEYDRVKKYNDITHLDFMSEGNSIHYIAVEWKDGSSDYSNDGQKVNSWYGDINITIE